MSQAYDKTKLLEFYKHNAKQRNDHDLAAWKLIERQRFLEELITVKAKSILELGAGTGKDSLFFLKSGLRVEAVDMSPEMVRLCMEKGVSAHCLDLRDLAFPEASFDAIYSMNALLHIPKQELQGVLLGIKQILKPQGLFYLGLHGGFDFEGIWQQDIQEPKRFFSLFGDTHLLDTLRPHFELIYFRRVSTSRDFKTHYQSLILKKV